jgi:hypothetical protein
MPSTPDMNSFTNFALQMMLPPNPVRALDNSLTAAAGHGPGWTEALRDPSDPSASLGVC